MLADKRHLGSEWSNEKEIDNQPAFIDENKTLFLVFSFAGVLALICFIGLVWYLINPRLVSLNLGIPVGYLFKTVIAFSFLSYTLIFLTAVFEKKILPINIRNSMVESYLFEFSQRVGKIFGISKDRIGNSFVKVNNALVRSNGLKVTKKRLLVLLPRCMQHMNCKENVVEDIDNCKECGQCNIAQFKQLGNRYDFFTHVATGGTLARKKIKEFKPTVILAVACERELVSGIGDAKSIPVIGLPNVRDEGPCMNTKTDIETVLKTISFLTDEEIKTMINKKQPVKH